MIMAILVTGGAGYIGSHTVVELLNNGENVVIVDNLSNSKREVVNRIRMIAEDEIDEQRLVFYEADIRDFDALDQILSQNNIRSVIHFAGLKAVGESVEKPLEYYENNITGTLVLLEALRKHEVKEVVFSSSATVYGIYNQSPLTEDMPLSVINPYGRTKLMIEQILTDLQAADSSMRIVLLRYFNPIGAHKSGQIGEDPSGIPNNLMPYITQVAIGKQKMLKIYGDDYATPDGTGVRDYIHVMDLASGHLKAIEYVKSHEGIEAINLGTGKGVSVFDMVHAFEQATGETIPYLITKRRPGDVGESYSSSEKAFKLLGWKAKYDLLSMCKDSWNWQKKNPGGYSEA